MMVELTLVAKVTVVFAVAIGATWVARSTRASVRSLILASAFAIVFLLPIGSAVAPARQVEIPVSYAATFFIEETAVDEPAGTPGPSPVLAAEPTRSISAPSLAATARTVWVVGAVLFVMPLACGLWRTRRLRRGSRSWDEGQRLAADLSDNRRIRVLLHDQLLAPMTCGWMRSVILMPADAREWATTDARQALLHELEHIRRHDWPIQVLARFTCALYWFHPAAWLAWRQLRLESERACDDAVVAGADSTAYAEQLVSLARKLSQHSPVPLLSMADRRTLSVRVSSILSHTVARGRVGTRGVAVILCGAVALALAIAPVRAVHMQEILKDAIRIPVATEGESFEVASVKPNLPDDRLRVNDWHPMTGRLTLRNLTPQTMLTVAYATTATLMLPDDRLVGVPDWARQERFTIEAVAGRPVTAAEMQRMLRRVLVERFGLRVHVEQREESALRLTMARADRRLGPDLRPADETNCKAARRPRGGSEAWGPQSLICTTIDLLALDLSERLGRPVLNQTGLTGNFDGTLSYAPSAEELTAIYRLSPSELPPAAMTGPALPTALREQLGLALESTRAAIDVLVVDSIDRPTPNDAPAMPVPAQVSSPSPAPLRFPVASVRPNDGSDPSRGFGFTLQTGRIRLRNQTLRTIVSVAYADTFGLWFPEERLSGGPTWMDTDRFTIEGRAERAVTGSEMGAMLRTLLAERFNLKIRLEPRQSAIYALVRARRDGTIGPELRVAASACAGGRCGIGGGAGRHQLSGASMSLLAAALAELTGRPVVDRTGLQGSFDGTLTWTPTPEEIGPLRDAAPAAPAPGFGASIFTAIEEQFGLKLQSERGPVGHLIVEHADRPIPNDAPELSAPER